ncbi:MAG: PTS sugar transporter subunit IIA [Planctomycetota bacterium]|jgi:fructose PTS system EIIBC or EIIC component|nr:PTS sugar transporter subunit IIA [Planctomycetota bacterium]
MNLARFLREERVDLSFDDQFDDEHPVTLARMTEGMASLLERSDAIVNPSKLRLDLANREKRAPSFLGLGIAMPHVRTLQARKLVMAVGISQNGLELDTPDDLPVRIAIALVGPPYDDKLYLQVYKRLSERLLDQGVLDTLLTAETEGEVVRALSA